MAIFIPNDQPLSQINAAVSGGPGILLFETLNDFDALIALCAESKGLGLSNIGRWLPGFDDWVSWFRDNPARDAPRRSEFIDATELKHPNNLTLLEGFEHAVRWARDIFANTLEADYLQFFASVGAIPEGLSYTGDSPALVFAEGSFNIALTPWRAGKFVLKLGAWVVGACVKAVMLPAVQQEAIADGIRGAAQGTAKYSEIPDLRKVELSERHAGLIVLIHGLFSTDLLTFDGLIDAWKLTPEIASWGDESSWNVHEMTGHLPGLWSDSTKKARVERSFERTLEHYCIAGWPHDTLAKIHDNALELATRLIKMNPQVPVVFVCHSRGGLVAREVLNILLNRKEGDWTGRIKLCLTFGTPHSGAALAQHPTTLAATYLSVMTKTRSAISLARVLSAYQKSHGFEGIGDLEPASAFLSILRTAEINSASANASAPEMIIAVGSNYSGDHWLMRHAVSLLLGDQKHDLVVPIRSSVPEFIAERLDTTCGHGDYFHESQISQKHFKQVIHKIREALGVKDRVIAESQTD